jgi:hypothetical protein
MKVDTPGPGEVLTYFLCLPKVCQSYKMGVTLQTVTIHLHVIQNFTVFCSSHTIDANNSSNKVKSIYVRYQILTALKSRYFLLHLDGGWQYMSDLSNKVGSWCSLSIISFSFCGFVIGILSIS